jgi:hypothetical protein
MPVQADAVRRQRPEVALHLFLHPKGPGLLCRNVPSLYVPDIEDIYTQRSVKSLSQVFQKNAAAHIVSRIRGLPCRCHGY